MPEVRKLRMERDMTDSTNAKLRELRERVADWHKARRAVFIANQPCINYFAPACRFNSGPLTEIVVK